MKKMFFLILAITTILFAGCKKENLVDNTGTPTSGSIFGMVVNEYDFPIEGASVSVGSQTVQTDGFGKFELRNPVANAGVVLIKATAQYCFTGYKNITKSSDAADYTVIKLINYDGTQTQVGNSATGGTAYVGSMTVNVGSGGFTTQSGGTYSGSISVRARYIMADDPQIDELMPGGDFSAVDTSGNNGIMETQGFVAIEFIDNNGNVVNPNTGNASITIQVSPAVTSSLSESRAWTLNNTSGKWNYSGGLTVGGTSVTLDYVGAFINCDVFASSCIISGRVVDCNNEPAKNRKVTFSSDILKYSGYTNASGYYSVMVSARPGSYVVACEDASATVSGLSANGSITATELKISSASYSNTYSQLSATTGFNGGCNFNYSNTSIEAKIACSGAQSTIRFKGAWSQSGDSCSNFAGGFDAEVPLANVGGNYSGSGSYWGVSFTVSDGLLNSTEKNFTAKVTANASGWDAPIVKNVSLK
jgi:hypothetical protein